DGDAKRGGNRGVRCFAIEVDLARRPGDFVRAVQRRSSRIRSTPPDRANVGARRIIGVGYSGGEIGRARRAVPIGRVIAVDTEVRAAHNFEVVGQAGVGNGKVVGCQIGRLGILVDKTGIRVV